MTCWNLDFLLVMLEIIKFWNKKIRKIYGSIKHHTGATEYPESMLEYLEKEAENKPALGPFKSNPFKIKIKISPVNSVPKKDTEER